MTKVSMSRENLGFWGSWQLPTPPALKVLLHLIEPGEPRLYVEYDGPWSGRASLSNSEHSPGWPTQIYVQSLISNDLVELDPERTPSESLKAYAISQKGREAIAQSYADIEYRKRTQKLASRILKKMRRQFGVVKKSRNR